MRITVFGANGPTGRLLVGQALAAGHEVVAVTRRPDDFPLEHPALDVVQADVHDEAAVDHAVRGSDAVLSSLGVPFTRAPVTVYSGGVSSIVQAMAHHSVKRLVVVSSSATEPHHHADGGFVMNRILQPLITRTIGRTTYADMRRMEAIVRGTDLAWTIIRPSGLFDAPDASGYRIDEDRAPGVFTARIDLAAAMLDQVDDDGYVGKVAAVTTVEGLPTLFAVMRAEAFKKE